MIKATKYVLVSLAMVVSLAPAAQAQMSYYFGGGVAYTHADSLPDPVALFIEGSAGDLFGLGLTGGVRFDNANLFYGAEVDADINVGGAMTSNLNGLSCADGFADAPYYCSQGTTVRLRGLFGTNIQGYEVFGTVGYAVMIGQAAAAGDGSTVPVSVGGITYGVGAQHTLGAGKMRAEVIWDNLDSIVTNPSGNPYALNWIATTAKVTYIIEF